MLKIESRKKLRKMEEKLIHNTPPVLNMKENSFQAQQMPNNYEVTLKQLYRLKKRPRKKNLQWKCRGKDRRYTKSTSNLQLSHILTKCDKKSFSVNFSFAVGTYYRRLFKFNRYSARISDMMEIMPFDLHQSYFVSINNLS